MNVVSHNKDLVFSELSYHPADALYKRIINLGYIKKLVEMNTLVFTAIILTQKSQKKEVKPVRLRLQFTIFNMF